MRDTSELPYKTSRKAAGFTQMDVVDQLGVADTTLSAYENGARVPDDIVDKMCELYNDPLLAYWHMRQTTLLGAKYLPPITQITSGGEMAFQSIIAKTRINPVVDDITQIMSDGVVLLNEKTDWMRDIDTLKEVAGRLLSVLLFSRKVEIEKEKAPTTAVTVASARCNL